MPTVNDHVRNSGSEAETQRGDVGGGTEPPSNIENFMYNVTSPSQIPKACFLQVKCFDSQMQRERRPPHHVRPCMIVLPDPLTGIVKAIWDTKMYQLTFLRDENCDSAILDDFVMIRIRVWYALRGTYTCLVSWRELRGVLLGFRLINKII